MKQLYLYLKLLISNSIKFRRFLNYTFRKIINKKDIWSVYKFKNYDEYIRLQKSKTLDFNRRKSWLSEEWDIKLSYFEDLFSNIINTYNITNDSKSLCLGARTGQEVQAFKNLNIDSIGIDIVPSEPLVIYGDIHQIPFENETYEIIFTNIVDHSLYPEKLIKEAERVTKPKGLIILHISVGNSTDKYGVTEIATPASIENLFLFSNVIKSSQMKSWHGLNWEIIAKKK